VRVLHINSYSLFAPLYRNLYEQQIKEGLDINVYIPVNNRYKNAGNDIGEYAYKSPVFSDIDRLLFFRKHKKILKDIKTKYEINNYDILHAHSLFSNGYIAYCLKKEYGIPYVVAVRNTDVNVFFKKMKHLKHIGRAILKEADKIVFLSKPYREQVINKYIAFEDVESIAQKSVVIPNGINQFWIDNKNIENKVLTNNSTVNILCVSDIDKNKNHLTTLKACKKLQKCGYIVNYNIVGRIKNKKVYETLVKDKCVTYLGTMYKEELIECYRGNDIFVMPSFKETFGLVYPEAMTQGLPVIYTINQGFDCYFEEGIVGYHVNPHSPEDIFNKIQLIINNYVRISNQCISYSEQFNWHDITKQYTELYKEII